MWGCSGGFLPYQKGFEKMGASCMQKRLIDDMDQRFSLKRS